MGFRNELIGWGRRVNGRMILATIFLPLLIISIIFIKHFLTFAQVSGTPLLRIVPALTTVDNGQNFNIDIEVDSGITEFNAIGVYLNFDPNYLEVVSTQPSNILNTIAQDTFDNVLGQINFAAGLQSDPPSSISGTYKILSVTLKGKGVVSSTPISFELGNESRLTAIANEGNNYLVSAENATITINAVQAPFSVTNVTTQSGRVYEVDSLTVGKRLFTDRTYTFTNIPALYNNQTYIRTANADKYSTFINNLSFNISTDASVYLILDNRTTTVSSWLDGSWTLTSDIITTSDIDYFTQQPVTRRVYKKDFPTGQVIIGGNGVSPVANSNSNYNIVVIPTASTSPTPTLAIPSATPTATPTTAVPLVSNISTSSGRNYVSGNLTVGSLIFTDRSYTFSSIPGSYLGKTYIKTANSDKYSTSLNHLTFTLGQNATVFIAFDDRSTNIPSWLDSNWILTGDKIITNDIDFATQNPVQRRIYQKNFTSGQVVLGGNGVPPVSGADSNYTVIIVEN